MVSAAMFLRRDVLQDLRIHQSMKMSKHFFYNEKTLLHKEEFFKNVCSLFYLFWESKEDRVGSVH